MADKKTPAVNPALKKKQRAFEGVCKSLRPLGRASAILQAIALLLFLVPFICIYNTDIPGIEIKVGGFSAALCALTGQFTNVGAVFGNMDIFNHFAPTHCRTVAICAAAAAVLLLVSLVMCVLLLIGKAPALHTPAAAMQFAAGVALIVGFAFALAMSKTQLLPEYCSSNPACSVRSYAILSAIVTLVGGVVSLAAGIRYIKAKKNV